MGIAAANASEHGRLKPTFDQYQVEYLPGGEAINDGGNSDMSNAATTSLMSTRTLLWVVFIANVIAIGIGLSLLERAELIIKTASASKQSEEFDLTRIYKLLADTNQRVNAVQIQLGPLPAQIKDIESRVNAIQTTIEASTATK